MKHGERIQEGANCLIYYITERFALETVGFESIFSCEFGGFGLF